MKIAIIGYGKMGHAVEAAAQERGWEIVARVRSGGDWSGVESADVAIEFSRPDSAIENICRLAHMGKQIVVGTTAWERSEIEATIKECGVGLLYADNFSLSVHLFARAVEEAARKLEKLGKYQVGGFEAHHKHKLDAPSGTAKMISKKLSKAMPSKSEEELAFRSVRTGEVPGTHAVTFSSNGDTLTFTHEAHNREAWGKGACEAAKWLTGRQGIYSIDDMLEEEQTLCTV